MDTGNSQSFTLQRPNYLKIINCTSLDQGANIDDSIYLKNKKIIDFSYKTSFERSESFFFSNRESRYPANSLAQRNLVRVAEALVGGHLTTSETTLGSTEQKKNF